MLQRRRYFGEQFHVYKHEPEIFAIAEAQVAEEIKDDPRILPNGKFQIEVPVPFLHVTNHQMKSAPIVITKDWYVKTKRKWIAKVSKEKRILQEEMMDCVADKDVIRAKLGKLDPANPKHKEKIIKLNCKLKDLDAEIEMLSHQAGVKIESLDHGSKFDRFMGKVSMWFKRAKKKVKEFIDDYAHIIQPAAIVVGAFIAKAVVVKLFGTAATAVAAAV